MDDAVPYTHNKKALALFLFLGALMVGAVYTLYASGLIDLFLNKERLLHFIRSHRAYAALIFIGLQTVQVVAAPVPGEVTGFVGGFVFGPIWGVIYSTIGLTLGSWLAFMLARLFGQPLIEKLVNPDTFRQYDYVLGQKGRLIVFLMFLIPGFPKDYLCYLIGLGHMRQRDFLIVSVPGRLLGTIFLTLGGTYLRSQHYGALFAVSGVILVVAMIALIYRKKLERWLRLKGIENERKCK